MNDFITEYQYHLAWTVYLASGLLFGIVWWRVTHAINHAGWRDLLRGLAVVVIFVPWYTSELHDHLAPAVVVALMDLLLGTSDNGISASLVLLAGISVVIVVLILRRFLTKTAAVEE